MPNAHWNLLFFSETGKTRRLNLTAGQLHGLAAAAVSLVLLLSLSFALNIFLYEKMQTLQDRHNAQTELLKNREQTLARLEKARTSPPASLSGKIVPAAPSAATSATSAPSASVLPTAAPNLPSVTASATNTTKNSAATKSSAPATAKNPADTSAVQDAAAVDTTASAASQAPTTTALISTTARINSETSAPSPRQALPVREHSEISGQTTPLTQAAQNTAPSPLFEQTDFILVNRPPAAKNTLIKSPLSHTLLNVTAENEFGLVSAEITATGSAPSLSSAASALSLNPVPPAASAAGTPASAAISASSPLIQTLNSQKIQIDNFKCRKQGKSISINFTLRNTTETTLSGIIRYAVLNGKEKVYLDAGNNTYKISKLRNVENTFSLKEQLKTFFSTQSGMNAAVSAVPIVPMIWVEVFQEDTLIYKVPYPVEIKN